MLMKESQAVGRAAFSEHAEAIGVPTDQILNARPHPDGGMLVLFNEAPWDPEGWRCAWLVRDQDEIFREKGRWMYEEKQAGQT